MGREACGLQQQYTLLNNQGTYRYKGHINDTPRRTTISPQGRHSNITHRKP